MSFNTPLDAATLASLTESLNAALAPMLQTDNAELAAVTAKLDAIVESVPPDIVFTIMPTLDEEEDEEEDEDDESESDSDEDDDEHWEDVMRRAKELDEIDEIQRIGGYWRDYDYNEHEDDQDDYDGGETGLDWNEGGYFD